VQKDFLTIGTFSHGRAAIEPLTQGQIARRVCGTAGIIVDIVKYSLFRYANHSCQKLVRLTRVFTGLLKELFHKAAVIPLLLLFLSCLATEVTVMISVLYSNMLLAHFLFLGGG
jgi:hypothetical protein